MQWIVKGLDGRQRAVSTAGVSTVGQLKSVVLEANGIPGVVPLCLVSGGRRLSENSLLSEYEAEGLSSVELRLSVLGGGGDGGATGAESRECYLSMYLDKKPDKVDPNEARLALWTRCHLSSEFLTPPCVVDHLGNLFNKDAVVQALLTKSMPAKFSHIKGLKDLINVHFSPNPSLKGVYNGSSGRFVCPITSLEFNGRFKFVALKKCGHVLSLKAMKEIHSSNCLVCQAPFSEPDQIIINGTDEEVQLMRERMEQLKSKSKTKSKEKKTASHQETDQKPSVVDMNPQTGSSELDSTVVLDKPSHSVNETKAITRSTRKAETEDDIPSESLSNKKIKRAKVSEKTTKSSHQVKERPKGSDRISEPQKFVASEHMPEGATKSVYASIFTSSSKNSMKETFACRNLPLGRN